MHIYKAKRGITTKINVVSSMKCSLKISANYNYA